MKSITFRASAEDVAALNATATAQGVTISHLLRRELAKLVGSAPGRSRTPARRPQPWPSLDRATVRRHLEIQQLLLAIAEGLAQCRTTGDPVYLPVIHCLLTVVFYQAETLMKQLGGIAEC